MCSVFQTAGNTQWKIMDPPPPFKESHIDQGVLSNDQTFFKNFHAPSLTHAFVTQKIRKFRSPR